MSRHTHNVQENVIIKSIYVFRESNGTRPKIMEKEKKKNGGEENSVISKWA